MDVNSIEKIVNEKLLNDIDTIIEYNEIGIYQGLDGCVKYIQKLTGCDKTIAIQIINEHEELKPSNETPEHYEIRIKAVNAEARELMNKPKCPTCSSTNLKKISTTSKVVNTAMWGFFGTKRHKTFHCNNCGYEW